MDRYGDALKVYDRLLKERKDDFESIQRRAYAYYNRAFNVENRSERHEMRRLALLDLEKVISSGSRFVDDGTYLLKAKLHFWRGEYAIGRDMAKRGKILFPDAAGEFDSWMNEIKDAERSQEKREAKEKARRKEKSNWFKSLISRVRRKKS